MQKLILECRIPLQTQILLLLRSILYTVFYTVLSKVEVVSHRACLKLKEIIKKSLKKFSGLPTNAKRYILLHTIGSPLMIGDYVVLVYLLLAGYKIISVGAIFTMVNFIELLFPAILGRLYDTKINAKLAMSLIYFLEGLAYFFFYLVSGPGAWIFLVLGVFIMKLATVFYPIFPTYEHYVYTEEIREKAMLYHLMVPEYVQIVAFPIFGFFLTYLYPSVSAYRNTLLFVSAGSFLMLFYIFYAIEDIRKEKIEKENFKFSIPKDFLSLFLIEDALIIAESMVPTITLTYFVMFILKQSFFVLMLLEVTNSAVTIIGGHYLKRRNINKRNLLIGGVILFAFVNVFYIIAVWEISIIPVIIGIIVQTLGNLFWFPVHRTMLFKTIPKEKRGIFFGSMSIAFRVSTAAAPFVSVLLISLWAYLPFALAGSLYFLAGLGYYTITKHSEKTF